MKHAAFRTAAAAALLAIAVGQFHAYAIADHPGAPGSDQKFSPLFAKRLEVGVQNMDKQAGKVYMAGFLMDDFSQPLETPLSANPVSLCLASGCFGSGCLGSACLLSACIGSACATSKCVGSGCVVSICAGSACTTSTCGGSVCAGSVCVGSVCVGTACLGSACVSCPNAGPWEDGELG